VLLKYIHYTELMPAEPASPNAQAWETYRREAGRLLAEGHEGKWALLKDERIVGIFDTYDAARDVGSKQFLLQGYLIQQIRTSEPVYFRPRLTRCPI
jgi:hypothetical protein